MGEGFKVQHGTPVYDTNIYIYKDGAEETTLTDGIDTYYSASTYKITKEATSLKVTYTSGSYPNCEFCTNTAMDLTKYKTLKFECNFSNLYTGAWFGVNSSKVTGWVDTASAHASPTLTGIQTFSLDVSALNGNYFIFGKFGASTSVGSNGNIYKIWLEA